MTSEANTELASPDDGDVEVDASYAAPDDPVIAEGLEAPSDPFEIYSEEASHHRPISTGDVFASVTVPGEADHESPMALAMVVAHPSAMRKGAALEKWVRAAPVAPIQNLSKTRWSPGYFDVFPLPLLSQVAEDNGFEIQPRGWGTKLEFTAPTESARLDVCERVACLSPVGVHLLLQRLVHSGTRVAVPVRLLAETFSQKLEEIEVLQDWTAAYCSRDDEGVALRPRLLEAAQAFEELLDSTPPDATDSIRAMLRDAAQVANARRHIRAEIRRLASGNQPEPRV